MAFEKLRAFMDVGRVQGVPVTAAVAILGSLTASRGPEVFDLFWLVIISIFAHVGGAAQNELWDRRLDAAVKELGRKPLVSGALAPHEARALVGFCVPFSLGLTLYVFGVGAFLALLLGSAWMLWYCTAGKRTFIVCDLAQSVGFSGFALFGVLAVGAPTILSWPFLGIVAALVLFTQWGNGLKDADNDRRFGIPSFAVRSGVSSGRGLTASHPYFIYGAAIKVAFMTFCTIPILLVPVPMAYILIVFSLGWPVQYFTMREFIGRKTRPQYVRLLVGDLLLSYPAAAAMSIMGAGLTGFIWLGVFVFGGYLAGSALQSGAEFKFRMPISGPARPLRPRPLKRPAQLRGAPFLMAWAPRGKGGFRQVECELLSIRPPDPLPALRPDGTRADGVCMVEPLD